MAVKTELDRRSDEKHVESVAYHEAGHMVVAAVLGFPLSRRGLRIDEKGLGLASYKKPDPKSCNTRRENIIIVANAGLIEQMKFYGADSKECRTDGANSDHREIESLLDIQYPSPPFTARGKEWSVARENLRQRSEELVEHRHWATIETLAKALLHKDWVHGTSSERRWSWQPREKSIEGKEVRDILSKFEIVVGVED